MKKLLFMMMLAVILTGCSNGVSQEKYDALLAENEQLRQQLAQYEGASNIQDESLYENDNISNNVPSSDSDFIYVNNGREVQINGYKGDGGRVVIPDEIDGAVVTRIATDAFKGAENITSIILPKNLQYIGDGAFYALKNLTGVLVIPETVTVIDGHAFQSTRLTGLVIKSSCEIGVNTFANIDSLEFIYVEEGCAPKIGISAFCYAEALTVAVFPKTIVNIKDETFNACNSMVIYTPQGSYAEEYANRNFIGVNTESYTKKVADFEKQYGKHNQAEEDKTNVTTMESNLEKHGITDEETRLYANVLNTINSLKQIHANADTITLLGAVVMNYDTNNPRTVVYISYTGLDNKNHTDYFWKDMNEIEIKAIFAKDNYTGNKGLNTVKELDLNEIAYYETSGEYVPKLTPSKEIYLDK